MATVFLPARLREFTLGAPQVPASGETLREVIEDLERQHPELRGRALDLGVLRPEVFLGSRLTEAFGMDIRVEAASAVPTFRRSPGMWGQQTVTDLGERVAVAELYAELRNNWRAEAVCSPRFGSVVAVLRSLQARLASIAARPPPRRRGYRALAACALTSSSSRPGFAASGTPHPAP
jgi:hypothetical protein